LSHGNMYLSLLLGPAVRTRIDVHSSSVQFQPTGAEPWWLTCVYGPPGSDESKNYARFVQLALALGL
jgi:hypothetical protein